LTGRLATGCVDSRERIAEINGRWAYLGVCPPLPSW
jgi:hypothetical protein